MAKNELEIDVNVNLAPTFEQAKRALKIVEWYINDTGDDIGIVVEDDGEKQLYFEAPSTHFTIDPVKLDEFQKSIEQLFEPQITPPVQNEKELTEIAIVQITNVCSGPGDIIDKLIKDTSSAGIARRIKEILGADDVIVTEYKQFVRDKH